MSTDALPPIVYFAYAPSSLWPQERHEQTGDREIFDIVVPLNVADEELTVSIITQFNKVLTVLNKRKISPDFVVELSYDISATIIRAIFKIMNEGHELMKQQYKGLPIITICTASLCFTTVTQTPSPKSPSAPDLPFKIHGGG